MIRLQSLAIILIFSLFVSAVAHAQPLRAPELPAPGQGQIRGEPGYLGVIGDDRQESGRGVRITEAIAGTPAAQAGLLEGDLITAINNQPVHSKEEMGAILQPLPPGAKVAFSIERNGQNTVVNVPLGNRPPPDQRRFKDFGKIAQPAPGQTPPAGQSPSGPSTGQPQTQPANPTYPPTRFSDQPDANAARPPLLGIKTLPVYDQDRARLRLQSNAGALVVVRTLGSPAEKANIPIDAVIVAVDGKGVNNPNDLSALLAQAGAGRTVEITYLWNGETAQSKVTLGGGTGWTAPRTLPAPGGVANDIGRRPANQPNPSAAAAQPTRGGNQQVEALEERVRELEQRVRQLEDQLQHRT